MAREVIEVITPSNLADLDSDAATKLAGIDAGAEVNPADLAALDSTANSKLDGIDDGATVDQTGLEVQTLITSLDDADRILVGSEPEVGEKKIYGIHFNAAGNTEYDREDTAES